MILGQVLTAGSGQNPARQAVDQGRPAGDGAGMTINKVCGSRPEGRDAGGAGDRATATPSIVMAGGQENMSPAPHVLPGSRDGLRMGDCEADRHA